jgi:opacity protein-like surface antigen
MKRALLGVMLVVAASGANAADLPQLPPVAPPVWSWTGLYLGGQIGAGVGFSRFPNPAGPSIFGGDIRSPIGLAGLQAGYNWQVPNADWVLGVEAEAAALGSDWSNTCLASSGFFISANCRVRETASGSLTGRVGYASSLVGHTLFYAKGGAAWLREKIGITTNGVDPALLPLAANLATTRWGWTVGAGAEKALTPVWSVRLEYDYANFGKANVALPASFAQVAPSFAYAFVPGGTSAISQSTHTVKVGLNLKFGESVDARWVPASSDYRLRGISDDVAPAVEIEVGARSWYSFGRFQKDLGGTTDQSQQDLLVSRLTYQTSAVTGEIFGRADGDTNFFLKGFVGAGKAVSGKMNDEDWVIFDATVPYSNTLSDPVKASLSYATFDVGYAVFNGPSSKVGGFVGYNYFRDRKSAFGCNQIANQNSDCVPALSTSILGITEDDSWHSLRIGINGVVKLGDRLSLMADAAYLPLVFFRGVDNHLLRSDVANTVSPESGRGQGVQLESVLSYRLADAFSVGVGGRYWAMWTTSDAITNIFGSTCPCQTLPARTDIFGGFLQASYRFSGLK